MSKTVRRPNTPTSRRSRYVHKKRFQPWMGWTLGLALIGLVVAAFLLVREAPVVADITGVTSFSNLSRNHLEGKVNYPLIPPVGGDHSASWQNCGIYDKPVASENAVHSLEHGAVWLAYRPDLAAPEVEQLRKLARGRSKILLSPYQGLPGTIVASSWGHQLKVDNASDPRLGQFTAKYQNSSLSPEPSGVCSGAIGSPLER